MRALEVVGLNLFQLSALRVFFATLAVDLANMMMQTLSYSFLQFPGKFEELIDENIRTFYLANSIVKLDKKAQECEAFKKEDRRLAMPVDPYLKAVKLVP